MYFAIVSESWNSLHLVIYEMIILPKFKVIRIKVIGTSNIVYGKQSIQNMSNSACLSTNKTMLKAQQWKSLTSKVVALGTQDKHNKTPNTCEMA